VLAGQDPTIMKPKSFCPTGIRRKNKNKKGKNKK
jgi:hypothetical protein